METSDWITLGSAAAIAGFLWSLHRDVRGLSDRVARIEGVIDDLRGLPERVAKVEGLLEGRLASVERLERTLDSQQGQINVIANRTGGGRSHDD